ncbi:Malectin-like domain [Dillenia turbinata]|uniref:Malectin-like domain n=1 Tax=Dillenia turbinata TaxID=194707 RepID=A0AAN8ZQ05_9MAGN
MINEVRSEEPVEDGISITAGAGLTGYNMARRIGSIEEFEFKAIGENHNQERYRASLSMYWLISAWVTRNRAGYRNNFEYEGAFGDHDAITRPCVEQPTIFIMLKPQKLYRHDGKLPLHISDIHNIIHEVPAEMSELALKCLCLHACHFGSDKNKEQNRQCQLKRLIGMHTFNIRSLFTYPVYSEIIYASKSDNTILYWARTMDDQFPFISSLEAFPLPNAMYPRDEYYRIWEPKIPKVTVVVNAPATADAITLPFPSSEGKSLDHVIVGFTEIHELEINETRQFDFNMNGEKMLTLNPEYRTCLGAWANSQSEGTLTVVLCPTEDLALPPIINAIEVYRASYSLVTTGTSQDDLLQFGNGRLAAVMTSRSNSNVCIFNYGYVRPFAKPLLEIHFFLQKTLRMGSGFLPSLCLIKFSLQPEQILFSLPVSAILETQQSWSSNSRFSRKSVQSKAVVSSITLPFCFAESSITTSFLDKSYKA